MRTRKKLKEDGLRTWVANGRSGVVMWMRENELEGGWCDGWGAKDGGGWWASENASGRSSAGKRSGGAEGEMGGSDGRGRREGGRGGRWMRGGHVCVGIGRGEDGNGCARRGHICCRAVSAQKR